MRAAAAAIGLLALGACASGRVVDGLDAAGEIDASEPDATADDAAIDAPPDDAAAPDAAIDAAIVDARIDAPPPIDAAIDAPPPIDAAIDAPMCTPTWHEVLGNGGFENAIAPWTQTSTIIRTSAQMPFAPQAGTYAALFGASNNANDVLVQNIAIPASATALRLRGYQCHVTEDPISNTDTFDVTLETPAGNLLESLQSITNSNVAPICLWQSFTWNAATPHGGQSMVLRLRGRTNFALLTRFAVDSLALEWLGC